MSYRDVPKNVHILTEILIERMRDGHDIASSIKRLVGSVYKQGKDDMYDELWEQGSIH